MTAKTPANRTGTRRETATRRAFYLWMAAYIVVIVAIAAAHLIGGVGGTAIDANGIRTQQAKVIGEPQSSLAGGILLPAASDGRDG